MDLSERRILHVITRSDWGGAPRIVELLATGTDATAAVACGTGGELVPRLREAGIEVFEQPHLQSPIDPRADTRALVDLYRLCRRGSFDLVHCHSTKAGLLGRLAATTTRTPTVFTVHGWGFYNTDYAGLTPIVGLGERAMARVTDEIVCVSRNDFHEGEKRGIVGDNARVIHNGIPPIDLPDDRPRLHEELGVGPETTIVGAVARLAPQKDPLAILETGWELAERGHDVTTVLVGDGGLREQCERYIERHGFEAHLLGFRERAIPLLADIDVFALPSRFEGFPLTVLECLHLGVPVVAYDVGGVAEAIDDGETGFMVTPGDRSGFVDRVERLVTDKSLREAIRGRAKAVAATEFTAERMVERYEETYERCLVRGRRRSRVDRIDTSADSE